MSQPAVPDSPDVLADPLPPPAPGSSAPTNPASPSDESPDRDTPAWEGAEPGDTVGLVDPRPEIPTPRGL